MFLAALRWLLVVPSTVLGHIAGTWLYFFGVSYGLQRVSADVRYAADFAGHLILGPPLVFLWFAVASGVATWAGLTVAPSRRHIAAYLLGALLVAFLGFVLYGYTLNPVQPGWEHRIRLLTEVAGTIAGFAAGVLIVREEGKFRDAQTG